ncbi:MAG: KUP/HAK/KT family potassium transporter [Desulfobacterales bacterium]|nr:MAG: KUP/HAK/KT family potassium transporter [Desulfobacterales bacterium]
MKPDTEMRMPVPGDSTMKGVIRSFGLVFGDIGTSPIYTLSVIFLLTKPSAEHVIGVLSLIIWTLVTLVSVEYAWLAMSLGKKGEGGTIVLKEILVPLLRGGRRAAFVTLLAYIGISLLIGDGIITPAISILSAVEGLMLIPGLESFNHGILMIIACGIAAVLFVIQRRGTDRVADTFGPIMVLWFLALTLSGMVAVSSFPSVLKSVNPYFAVHFLAENGLAGFFVLSEVILCATGGEALYADMGHLGRQPIIRAWYFVFTALLINYLGQGAYIIQHPEAKSVLFEMVFHQAKLAYVPFLLLSILATVIASQAMISSMFSIVYQGINIHIMPLFKIEHTSSKLRSQIYIGTVNWFLLLAVIFIVVQFRESHRLAAAYGLAVTGTMTLTGIMMIWIFGLRKQPSKFVVSVLVTLVAMVFLTANVYKLPNGGYWSLLLAGIPFSVILIYTSGQRRLYRRLSPAGLTRFLERYQKAYLTLSKIEGTGLFFVRDIAKIPPYITHTMFTNNIIYTDNIFVSVMRLEEPFGVSGAFKEALAAGLRVFEIQYGYMEVITVETLLRKSGINEKAIFYGLEDIVTRNAVWKVFAIIKRLSPTFIQFHKLPPHRLHGVVTQVKM